VPQRGLAGGLWQWNVTSLHGERQLGYNVGQLYNIVTNGYNTMPAYAAQIPVNDRWAIATYVRALQISQAAPLAVVPAPLAQAQGWNR
jgi:mono/diheme cytochrome c family protein